MLAITQTSLPLSHVHYIMYIGYLVHNVHVRHWPCTLCMHSIGKPRAPPVLINISSCQKDVSRCLLCRRPQQRLCNKGVWAQHRRFFCIPNQGTVLFVVPPSEMLWMHWIKRRLYVGPMNIMLTHGTLLVRLPGSGYLAKCNQNLTTLAFWLRSSMDWGMFWAILVMGRFFGSNRSLSYLQVSSSR